MTEARFNQIAYAVAADQSDIKRILQLDIEDAVKEFQTKGYDFTKEELCEFGAQLTKLIEANQSGELDENALNEVAGGCGYCAAVGAVVGAALGLGGTILLFW